MSKEAHFWWDWGVQVAVAVGTLAVAFAAVFGDWLKAKFVKLSLSIEHPEGVPSPTQQSHIDGERIFAGAQRQARFFQLRVSNSGRFGRAHRVYVYLLAVDDIEEQTKTTCRVHARSGILLTRIAVFEDGELMLQPMIPALALRIRYTLKCRLILTVQARSDEAKSPEMRILVGWDGRFGKDSNVVFKFLRN
jgi:hypothetical protein